MRRNIIRVTDHALLRHLERVEGIDVDAIRVKIAAKVDTTAAHVGVTGVLVDGFRYVLDQGRVVTVMKKRHIDVHAAGRVKDHPQ